MPQIKKSCLKLLYEAGFADRFHDFLNVVLQDKTSQTTQPRIIMHITISV
jgi:hypothetical protein